MRWNFWERALQDVVQENLISNHGQHVAECTLCMEHIGYKRQCSTCQDAMVQFHDVHFTGYDEP